MLRQRVITALVLLALLLPALFAASALPFALFTLLLVSAAGWEWARLNGVQAPLPALATGALVALMCAASLRNLPQMGHAGGLWWAGTLLWLVGGALVLLRGPAGWPALPQGLRWALGPLLLWLAWLALAQARTIGVNFLLSAMCVVWVADISAYFCGRAFGQRKLAITISPGKSWEGAIASAIASVILGVIYLPATIHGTSYLKAIFLSLGANAAGQIGDLAESAIKRSAGVKDSGTMLPGHGGMLDRLDSSLFAMPVLYALLRLSSR